MTVIDVNTGRFVGKHSQEDTVLRTNLEAVGTIVEQLRLRNIGGIVIIDFIDMERAANRRKVFEALTAALKNDKARTTIVRLSELGLVEMTRKRTRESLPQLLCAPCPHCDGTGHVPAVQTVAYDLLRRVRHVLLHNPDLASVSVKTQPAVARFLADAERRGIEQLERETGKRIHITASADLPESQPFELIGLPPSAKTTAA
jgi:ribonuclease G